MAEQGEPIRIGVRELRGKLGDYLRQARSGARFLIVSRGQPVAELAAPSHDDLGRKPRQAGLLKGKIWIAEDFDEWPEGFIEAMEDGPIEPQP
ncbi:MAG TPA: type II toxin-antitoxin system prevent-host-death family antitoxin [Allosphingosinicella sp.]|jgi:antitoxin (DNA-binding transcriptional repressor) of toxin-antitoxin stability system